MPNVPEAPSILGQTNGKDDWATVVVIGSRDREEAVKQDSFGT
jgi:hypothetical protein